MISQYWFSFLNNLGSWPCERNMETVNIFDDLDGKGLDIGHDGESTFQNGNIIRLIIYPKKVQIHPFTKRGPARTRCQYIIK